MSNPIGRSGSPNFQQLKSQWENTARSPTGNGLIKPTSQHSEQHSPIHTVSRDILTKTSSFTATFSPPLGRKQRSATDTHSKNKLLNAATVRNLLSKTPSNPTSPKNSPNATYPVKKENTVSTIVNPHTPPSPQLRNESIETIYGRIKSDSQNCERVMQELLEIKKSMEGVSQASPAASFFLGTSLSRQLEDLQGFKKKSIFEFHQLHCVLDPDYKKETAEQEEAIKEIVDKIGEFITKMSLLLQALKAKDSSVASENNKQKEDFISPLSTYLQSIHSSALKKRLLELKDDIHRDLEAVVNTFQAIEKFFSQTSELTNAYIKYTEYKNIQIMKGKNPYLVSMTNRFGGTLSYQATTFLNLIPAELSRHKPLLERLINVSQTVSKMRQSSKYLSPIDQQLITSCKNACLLLTQFQEEMNSRNSILELYDNQISTSKPCLK